MLRELIVSIPLLSNPEVGWAKWARLLQGQLTGLGIGAEGPPGVEHAHLGFDTPGSRVKWE